MEIFRWAWRVVDRVDAHAWNVFHKIATLVWIILAIPSLLWWKDALVWVIIMSLWANVVGHWSAFQASRAEENGSESNDQPHAGDGTEDRSGA